MVQIAGLFTYPVKSCRGISMEEVEIGPRGFLHDREFLVVDEIDTFLTQRNAPELATVDIAIESSEFVFTTSEHGELQLRFREVEGAKETAARRNVSIFRDHVVADDMGDAAAEWFSAVLHRACRLVRAGGSYSREVALERVAKPYRSEGAPQISFTDAFPTLLVSEASAADLNSRLPHPIPINRFRPNIVVRGAIAYEEDTWSTVRSRNISFRCSAACLRCVITTTDQLTGERDGAEPLRTLASYRRGVDGMGVMFGQYLVHSGGGKLRVGEALSVNVESPRMERIS